MSAGGATSRRGNPAKAAEEAERCFELVVKGWSVRRIADEVGLTPSTVQRRISDACARRVGAKVEHYRALQDETLDAAQTAVEDIIEAARDPELVLKAVDRLGRILERRARLHGLDAPVKVDTVVTQQTQAEAELEPCSPRRAALDRRRRHLDAYEDAPLMLAAGVPMAIGSKMLRHSPIGITVDTYGHLSEETAHTASDAIGALLDAAFVQAASTAADAAGDTLRPHQPV